MLPNVARPTRPQLSPELFGYPISFRVYRGYTTQIYHFHPKYTFLLLPLSSSNMILHTSAPYYHLPPPFQRKSSDFRWKPTPNARYE